MRCLKIRLNLGGFVGDDGLALRSQRIRTSTRPENPGFGLPRRNVAGERAGRKGCPPVPLQSPEEGPAVLEISGCTTERPDQGTTP